ncbi:MAG: hypothetical protein ACRD20_07055 [Terriglobales bacterium]
MECAEFQEVLPELLENDRTAEQELHLKSCPTCSALLADLDLIAHEARQLQEVAEPNSRVWNSIEIALRREGIIHDPPRSPSLTLPVWRHWTVAWLAPVAAVVLVAFGIATYQRGHNPSSAEVVSSAPVVPVANLQTSKNPPTVNNEDQQLLAAVASRAPAMRAQYASNLQNVNAYIRDAEASAQADPNDEEAQQIVMDAYEQRATVYEMALDRSLP